jgi:DNA-binding CsgD family transcriptional regulator
MATAAKQRALDKIVRLSGQGLDLVHLWRECAEPIASAIPHYWAPCWFTLDPATLLITSHFDEGVPEVPPEWLEAEYFVEDVHKLADIARSVPGLSTLHEATRGDPTSSPRWQANMQLGGDQEMIAALRTRSGDVWGALGLYREAGQPMFDAADKAFLHAVAPYLAEGARRALLLGEAVEPDGSNAPGLVVLDSNLRVESVTPGVEHWLVDLPDGEWETGRVPSAVTAVAARAVRTATTPGEPGEIPMARVLGRSGTWIVLHGAALVSPVSRRVAVIVEPAHPARISSLLMAVYGLTDREKDVTRLVLQGYSTTEIAETLIISPHTVQQHFKSIFDKTGVRSRRDLAGKVFFAHYEPRVRDNEQRAQQNRPLRGGPLDAGVHPPA